MIFFTTAWSLLERQFPIWPVKFALRTPGRFWSDLSQQPPLAQTKINFYQEETYCFILGMIWDDFLRKIKILPRKLTKI